MSYISNAITSAEIAALHQQILAAWAASEHIDWKTGDMDWKNSKGQPMPDFTEEFSKLIGMLPDDIRPAGVPTTVLYPGPTIKQRRRRRRRAEDML